MSLQKMSHSSNIKNHWPRSTIANNNNDEKVWMLQELPKRDTETRSEQMFLKRNNSDRLSGHRVAKNL